MRGTKTFAKLYKEEPFRLLPTLYVMIYSIYGYIGYYSFGYDDEFYNIRLIEEHGFSVFQVTQSTDIHPPASYIVNAALFFSLGKWQYVRLVNSLFAATCIIYAIRAIHARYGLQSSLIGFATLGINPAMLLWCTGLRWYALFVPILIWLSIVPRGSQAIRWLKFFSGVLLLSYINYFAIVVFFPLLLIYMSDIRRKNQMQWNYFVLFGLLAFFAYLPQLIIFFDVHLPNRKGQLYSFKRGIIGVIVANASNQGVFPVSIGGIASIFGNISILFVLMWSQINNKKQNIYLNAFLFGMFISFLIGLSGKFRNLLLFEPWQALAISTYNVLGRWHKVYFLSLFLILFGNALGAYNVASHSNTTKNSWNMPVADILRRIDGERSACQNDLLVLTHDRVLSWILRRRSVYNVLTPYAKALAPQAIAVFYKCVVVIKTHKGSLNIHQYSDMLESLEAIQYSTSERKYLYFDKYHKWKKMLDPAYPTHQVEWLKFTNVSNTSALEAWQEK